LRDSQLFGKANFFEAKFERETIFGAATFQGRADFPQANF
jgi:hypothetical protein